jgi:hypothetical protein
MIYFYRDASPRRRSPRRTNMVIWSLMRSRSLRKLPQLLCQHQLQHQLLMLPMLPLVSQRKISLVPPRLKLLKSSRKICSRPSPSEMLQSFRPLLITSHHFMMTLLREDMLEFFSVLPPNKRLSSQSMKMFYTLRDSMMPLMHSSNSHKMQELARRRWDNSTSYSRALEPSTH